MITFDGDRSKKRKWLAEKQLRTMQELDIEAKVIEWDGFTFRMWQYDDLSGGRVTAPMGVVVLCSSPSGIKISVADYWLGGFSTFTSLYTLLYPSIPTTTTKIFINPTKDEMIADGNELVLFRPMAAVSPYYMTDGVTPNISTVWVQDYSCFPGIFPHKGAEAFWVTTSDNVFIDLNNSGVADFPKYICESQLLFYQSNGNHLKCRSGFDIQSAQETNQPWRTMQHVGPAGLVMWHNSVYSAVEGAAIFTHDFAFPAHGYTFLENLIPAGSMPSALREIITVPTGLTTVYPCGSYCFSLSGIRISFHCVDVTNTTFPQAGLSEAYFAANPTEEKWRIFYILRIGTISYVINSDNFITLLDSLTPLDLTPVPPATAWNNIRRMMSQLAMAYPNVIWNVPYDSVMFHTHNLTVITWTRKYGPVEFTPSGMQVPTLSIPIEVSGTDGVRPDITFAGTFEAVPLYLCVCMQVGFSGKGYADLDPGTGPDLAAPVTYTAIPSEIKAIYYGSPFVSWTRLPGVPEGCTLVHVRPVNVTPREILLIGVIKASAIVDGVTIDKYFFASLYWKLSPENIPSTALWNKQGMLPFIVGVDNVDNFNLSLYGNDSMVNALYNYPSPPAVVPQFPIGPYDSYAMGQP